MEERDVGHISRLRDRDQRMPTFHMLVDHDQNKHQYHFHHQAKHEEPAHAHGLHNKLKKTRNSRKQSPPKPAANFEKVVNSNTPGTHNISGIPIRKRSHSPHPRLPIPTVENTEEEQRHSPHHHHHHHHEGIHMPKPKSGSSKESVSSIGSCRGPACNFSQFYVNSTQEKTEKVEKQVRIPESTRQEKSYHHLHQQHHHRNNPLTTFDEELELELELGLEDETQPEEPADVVVWNPIPNNSRPNLFSPVKEEENWKIPVKTVDMNSNSMKLHEGERRARSSSVPHSKPLPLQHPEFHHRLAGLGITSSLLFNTGEVDMLDECLIPPVRETSSSVSLVSQYSLQIALVTQQLEHIQQAQNDILKQLGEDISKVNLENEKLKKEIDHVRIQNDGLLQVIQETTDELERMKQIFRVRNIALPPSSGENRDRGKDNRKDKANYNHPHVKERERPRSTSPPQSTPPLLEGAHLHGKINTERRARHRNRSRESGGSNGGNGKEIESQPQTIKKQRASSSSPRNQPNPSTESPQHQSGLGCGENLCEMPNLLPNASKGQVEIPKRKSRKKTSLDDDSDAEMEKLKNGFYVGLNMMMNLEDEDTTSCNTSVDPCNNVNSEQRRRRRSRSRERRANNGAGGSITASNATGHLRRNEEPIMMRRERSHKYNSERGGRDYLHPPLRSLELKPVVAREPGCFSRMFSCCSAPQSYQKDYEDDMSALRDYLP